MSARDDVYDTVRTRLTTGFYGPHDALVPGALSDEFAVSRTPVREALGLLERDGLLISTSRGFVPWIRSDDEVLEIFEVRGVLESAAAESAAERRTEADVVRLREISRRSRAATDMTEIRGHLNAWHEAVRGAAHNETISTLLRTLDAHVKLAAPWRPEDTSTSRPVAERLREHDEIVEAIVAREPHRARELTLAHLRNDQQVRIRQRAQGTP